MGHPFHRLQDVLNQRISQNTREINNANFSPKHKTLMFCFMVLNEDRLDTFFEIVK